MRTFKINTRSYPKPKLAGLTKAGQLTMKRRLKAKMAEGTDKAKLRRSGLWDESAARKKSTLVITGINLETT